MKKLLMLVALLLVAGSASAQTALNQVYLSAAVTSDGQTSITLSAADSVSAGDVIYIDREAMTAVSCSSSADTCTVRRGQLGTRAEGHLNRSIVYTGAANRFYYYDPGVNARCVRGSAYPGGYEPWINVLTGNLFACTQTYGSGSTVAGQWVVASFGAATASPSYRAIVYNTSRTADATVVTPALSVNLWDVLIASLTYSGPFEVFLPNPTGLPLGKRITVSDFARLNTNAATSTAGRTITIRGLFDTDTTVRLAQWSDPGFGGASGETRLLTGVGATTSFYVGITASSMYYWFAAPW